MDTSLQPVGQPWSPWLAADDSENKKCDVFRISAH